MKRPRGCRGNGREAFCSRWFFLMLALFLDVGFAKAALIKCGSGPAIYSDCLIVRGLYGEMPMGLTEADEAAGKVALVTLPPRVFTFIDEQGAVSDVFSILTPVVITLQSDAGESGLGPAPPGAIRIMGETRRPFGFRVESDTEPGSTSDFCNFPTDSDCVITRILNHLIINRLAETDEGAPLAPPPFAGAVFDFVERRTHGLVVGDRLTIAPFSYSLVSDVEGGPPLPDGPNRIFSDHATIFNVAVRSDTDPAPEPGSFFLFGTGVMACISVWAVQSRVAKSGRMQR